MEAKVNNIIFKEHPLYQSLKESYGEACSEVADLYRENVKAWKELTFLKDFVRYKELEEEYQFFCEHAVPDPSEDLPFLHYILLS